MHALLAFSATHLAWLTDCQATNNIAYHHRDIALKGLQDGISNFRRENSDAVLAASILLSWQAADWCGWASLMQGTSTVRFFFFFFFFPAHSHQPVYSPL
jgi:hypothetical protein